MGRVGETGEGGREGHVKVPLIGRDFVSVENRLFPDDGQSVGGFKELVEAIVLHISDDEVVW